MIGFHILNNGSKNDGKECTITMCYSKNPLVRDKCLGWCRKVDARIFAQDLLEQYSKFLEKHNYIDTDWRDESPKAIDDFLKSAQ